MGEGYVRVLLAVGVVGVVAVLVWADLCSSLFAIAGDGRAGHGVAFMEALASESKQSSLELPGVWSSQNNPQFTFHKAVEGHYGLSCPLLTSQ